MLLDGCLSNLDSPVSVCGICAAKKSSTVCGFSLSEPTIKEAEICAQQPGVAGQAIYSTYIPLTAWKGYRCCMCVVPIASAIP